VTISGTISTSAIPSAPLAGVTVTFSNGGGTAVTDATGAYSANVNSGWTGTATPALAGYLFAATSTSYASLAANTTTNYTATAVVVITGTVASGTTPIPGVTVAFSTGQSVVTDASGNYSVTVNAPYTGTVTPSLANYVFTPASRTYTAVSLDQTLQNFAAQGIATISGTVTGVPGGVTVTLTASTGQTTTAAANGSYSFVFNTPYSGTITPSATGLVFSPASLSYSAITTDQLSQNFAAQVQIVGAVTLNGAALPGVTMTYTGGSVLTNASGVYTITVPTGWSGTVTPSLIGYLFTNTSNTYATLNTSMVTNYTAIAGIEINGQAYLNTVPITSLPNVSITFSGTYLLGGVATPFTATALTDVNGFYRQFVPSGFSGTATPTLATYAFNPRVRNFSNVTSLLSGRNFIATPTVTYSGTILSGATPIAGVNVAFSGVASVNTDVSGNYSITLNSGWTGTITPTMRGYTFSPASVSVATPVTVNSVQNFNTVQTITGRARVLATGTAVPGVLITLSTGQTTTTNANGNFTIQVPTGWTGSLTASGGGYTTWTPASFSYTNLTTNVTGLRFNGQ
jgi:hypothetical protein